MSEDAQPVDTIVASPNSAEAPSPSSPSVAVAADAALSLKRRQSDTSDTESKRRRLSTDDSKPNEPEDVPAIAPSDDRRKSLKQEERKRGQRLFGALLGTLSQGSGKAARSSAAQERRAAIEKKQQEKLRLQDEEDSQRRKEKLETLKATRRKQQRHFDEKTMRMRHTNMLHYARFLRTRTEPRLYYKPWEMTRAQEDQIDGQIEEARAAIDRELQAFAQRRAKDEAEELHEEQETRENNAVGHDNKVGHEPMQADEPAASGDIEVNANVETPPNKNDTALSPGDDASPETLKGSIEDDLGDATDEQHEVVEADEDTVIY